jgi:hypothetical protein
MAARLAQMAQQFRSAAAAQAKRPGAPGLDAAAMQSASREVQRWSTAHLTTLNVMNTMYLGSSSFIRSMVR